jgi:hypothetical protein
MLSMDRREPGQRRREVSWSPVEALALPIWIAQIYRQSPFVAEPFASVLQSQLGQHGARVVVKVGIDE